MKVVMLDAHFPEFKGGSMYQRAKGTGSTVRVATARAFGDLYKQPKVKGKRFSMMTVTLSVGTVPDEPTNEQVYKEESHEEGK
jgi:hypothetical protein